MTKILNTYIYIYIEITRLIYTHSNYVTAKIIYN